jgi:hypothetical protein
MSNQQVQSVRRDRRRWQCVLALCVVALLEPVALFLLAPKLHLAGDVAGPAKGEAPPVVGPNGFQPNAPPKDQANAPADPPNANALMEDMLRRQAEEIKEMHNRVRPPGQIGLGPRAPGVGRPGFGPPVAGPANAP